jgi:hypothetical protein
VEKAVMVGITEYFEVWQIGVGKSQRQGWKSWLHALLQQR